MSDEAPNIVLHLPIPPSANRIWRKVPGRRKPTLSEEYRAWLTEAGWIAKMQIAGIPMILGAFRAEVEVPIKSRRDRDNWTKPLFDLCQKAGAVRNDRGLGTYTVTPTDRLDCMVALFDLGGPALKEAKVIAKGVTRKPGKPRVTRPTQARIAAAHRINRIRTGQGDGT